KAKKCIIEAEFDAKGLDLNQFFEDENLEQDNHLILRREISAEGKSRSFLNNFICFLHWTDHKNNGIPVPEVSVLEKIIREFLF
ncbi:MAG TPA: hypothetical protein PK114_05305, partial [Smithellaceae bacterium]|nr:hypothetical protein [Smithellaceae bacterium]